MVIATTYPTRYIHTQDRPLPRTQLKPRVIRQPTQHTQPHIHTHYLPSTRLKLMVIKTTYRAHKRDHIHTIEFSLSCTRLIHSHLHTYTHSSSLSSSLAHETNQWSLRQLPKHTRTRPHTHCRLLLASHTTLTIATHDCTHTHMTTLAHNSPVTIHSHAHTQNRSYPRKELEPMVIETTNPPNTRAHNRIHTLSPSDITQTNDCSNLPNTRTQPHEPTQIQPRTHSLSPSHTTTPMVIETTNQTHDHLPTYTRMHSPSYTT